jgi:hypothetical protein
MNPGHLVWIRDFAARPCAEWWAELFYGTDNQYRDRMVAAFAAEHAGKPLTELAALYPAPAASPTP